MALRDPAPVRFARMYGVEVRFGCWLWRAGKGRGGYGVFGVQGRQVYAHRWAYEHFVGPIPEGLTLDHRCCVPQCVNPAHLEPVTIQENLSRGNGVSALASRKSHCINGHALRGRNLRIDRYGARRCRTCIALRQRQYRKRWRK